MLEFDFLVMLLPIAFMLHDFEEIILFKKWVNNNSALIVSRFPGLAGAIRRANRITTPAFTLVVAEEFILLSIISVSAVYYHNYYFWLAAFMAFSLHFLIHICQCLILRKYTPGVVTSFILTPACIYMFKRLLAEHSYTYLEIAGLSALGVVAMIINIASMHYLAGKLKI